MIFLPKLKATIVLTTGLAVQGGLTKYNPKIWWAFRKRGYDFKVAMMPPHGSIGMRAGALASILDTMNIKGDLHLIGHSLGGIDARMLLCFYDEHNEEAPKSLTTVGTPHFGSPIADYFLETRELPEDASNWELSTHAMTSKAMESFNETAKDNPKVDYFSIGGDLGAWGFVSPSWHICEKAGFPINDGMVPAVSARWGKYLATVTGGHIHQANPIRWHGHYVWPEVFGVIMDNLDKEYYS